MPNFEQIKCYEQFGSTDCRLFAIADAVDILNGNDIYGLIYDQTKMRDHLIAWEHHWQNTATRKMWSQHQTSKSLL